MTVQFLQPFLIVALVSFIAGLILGVRLVRPQYTRRSQEHWKEE